MIGITKKIISKIGKSKVEVNKKIKIEASKLGRSKFNYFKVTKFGGGSCQFLDSIYKKYRGGGEGQAKKCYKKRIYD